MEEHEAHKAADKILASWPATGVKRDVWIEVLADLEYETAQAAYRRLRLEQTHTPTIAHFVGHYHAIRRSRPTPTPVHDREHVIAPSDGLPIAVTAYIAECNRQERDPSDDTINMLTGALGG